MGAVLVMLVTLGLLSGFDSSTRASSINKQRSVASSLAQADQESLRTLTVAKLSNLRNTTHPVVGGVRYTVDERADWVSDDSGVISCTNSNSQASYIEITSSVTWTGMGTVTPVTAQSLVAPPVGTFGAGQGTAVLQIIDRNGHGVPGLSVAFGGPGAFNDVSDANGCTVFGYIPSGSYVGSASRGGWVDLGGNNPGQRVCSVPDGSTVLCQQYFDQAGGVTVSFDSKPYNSTTYVPAVATNVEFSNQSMVVAPPDPPLNGTRMFPPTVSSTPVSSITASNLFPFTDGYGIYAGTCSSADPRLPPTSNAGYYGSNPGLVIVGPGNTSYTPTVHEPALNVTVLNAAGSTVQNATVKITDVNCGNSFTETTLPSPDTTGHIPLPGLPFGTYNICARDSNGRKGTTNGVNNTNINGTAKTVSLGSSTGNPAC